MTVSRRKNKPVAKADEKSAAESGVQYHCDVCALDISSTVRISCATCETQPGALDTYDLCCSCFLEGAETGSHKAYHDYRVVEQHSYPIFCNDWGADEELLLIDGAQTYGLGNWADIADHIGNRTKEEVEDHYIKVFIEGRDGTLAGDIRAEEIVRSFQSTRDTLQGNRQQLPIAGPNLDFKAQVDAEEFQKQKRERIEDLRKGQAAFGASQAKDGATKPVAPKPLVSAPTSHSELGGFMPGRLEFEHEHEQDAENYIKDMEFGKVYHFGGETMPSELEALGGRAEKGKTRMEASGRGGPSLGSRGANKANKGAKGAEEDRTDKVKEENGEEGDEEEEEEEREREEREREKEEEEENEGEEENEEGDEPTLMDTSAVDGDDTQASQAVDALAAGEKQSTNDVAATASQQPPPAETDDRAPDWDEDEGDLDLKLTVLDIYNERLDRRQRRKEFVFARNLVDYKRTVAAERRRPKDEREVLNRIRHFAQMQTASDFEEFYNGLCYEDALRRAASQLQTYRRAGITNLTDAAKFETEQAERVRKALVAAEGGLAAFPAGGALPRSASARNARDTITMAGGAGEEGDSGSATPSTAIKAAISKRAGPGGGGGGSGSGSAGSGGASQDKKQARKPPKPLDLSQNPSLNMLTRPEQEFCSVVRIIPEVFIIMKRDIILEFTRLKGRLTRRDARGLFKCDVNKTGKLYDLLNTEGYLEAALRAGNAWDGHGTPPGWNPRLPAVPAVGRGTGEASEVGPVPQQDEDEVMTDIPPCP